jgi:hypothetical protein
MYYKPLTIIFCFFILSASFLCFSQDIDKEDVMKISSGMFWDSLNLNEKKVYIKGLEDGTVNVCMYYVTSQEDKVDAYSMLPTMLDVISYEGFIRQIDLFYKDPENYDIPIIYALVVVRNRLAGVKEEDIENYLAYLRGM